MSLFLKAPLLVGLALALLPGASKGQPTDLGRIMFLGNSFAEGHDSPNLTWKGGSRKVIEDILVQAGKTFEFVGRNSRNSEGMTHPKHNGYGGQGINDLFRGIVRDGIAMGSLTDWIKESGADIYIIDLGRKTEKGSSRGALKLEFMRVVDEIYRQNPKARIIWSEQVDPKLVWFPGEAEHLDRVNSVLNEVAADQQALGMAMQIASVSMGWNPEIHLDVDGVHPSDAGYLFLGRAQAKLILEHLNGANPAPHRSNSGSLPRLSFGAIYR